MSDDGISKHFYMLCGVPGSGKSTWVAHYKYSVRTTKMDGKDTKIQVLSTDDILEIIAWQNNLTYNDVFDDVSYAFAEKMMHKLAKFAFERADIVIWDQTNLTPKSRKKKLDMVPEGWVKHAIYFGVPEPVELTKRLGQRPGKFIPEKVMNNMIKNYVIPTKEEGFFSVQKVI